MKLYRAHELVPGKVFVCKDRSFYVYNNAEFADSLRAIGDLEINSCFLVLGRPVRRYDYQFHRDTIEVLAPIGPGFIHVNIPVKDTPLGARPEFRLAR